MAAGEIISIYGKPLGPLSGLGPNFRILPDIPLVELQGLFFAKVEQRWIVQNIRVKE